MVSKDSLAYERNRKFTLTGTGVINLLTVNGREKVSEGRHRLALFRKFPGEISDSGQPAKVLRSMPLVDHSGTLLHRSPWKLIEMRDGWVCL